MHEFLGSVCIGFLRFRRLAGVDALQCDNYFCVHRTSIHHRSGFNFLFDLTR